MAGATKDEGPMLAIMMFPQLREDLNIKKFHELIELQREIYHNIDVQKVSDYYLQNRDPENPHDLQRAFEELYGDMLMVCPTYGFAKRFAKSGRDVYFYRFNYQTNLFAMFGCDENTICHGADIAYVFGEPLKNPQMFTETDYDFSLEVMKIWTNFAKNM